MSAENEHDVWKDLLTSAYEQFHIELRERYDHRWKLFSFDFVKNVLEGGWIWPTNRMIGPDFNEAINIHNSWSRRLARWSAWINVLKQYSEADQWEIRAHFVEPIVESCMLQPSSARDRMGTLASHAIHQANRVVRRGYPDRMDQDWDDRTQKANVHLSRRRTEHQLNRLGEGWNAFGRFNNALRQFDTYEYRAVTRNYRNRVSHGIAPRFELGYVAFVTRSYGRRKIMTAQPDGSYRIVDHESESAVSYADGGIEPLSLSQMFEANGRQFLISEEVLCVYRELLGELLEAMRVASVAR